MTRYCLVTFDHLPSCIIAPFPLIWSQAGPPPVNESQVLSSFIYYVCAVMFEGKITKCPSPLVHSQTWLVVPSVSFFPIHLDPLMPLVPWR